MKNSKLLFLLTVVSLTLFLGGCKDEEVLVNQIVITIEEPIDGETIADCADVHVHVDFVASIENHEVEIVLHPEGDVNDKIIDFDQHQHDQIITFEEEVDLCSYGAGACFHLEVEACVDHDCAEKVFAEAEFCLQ